MAKTVISGSTPYCTLAQAIVFCDWNIIADLMTDRQGSGSAATFQRATKADVLASADALFLMQEASGLVELAFFKGGRYTAEDLAALAGTNGGAMLAGLTADVWLWRLWKHRRPDVPVPEAIQRAAELLDAIAAGEMVFGFQETADAGRMGVPPEDPVSINSSPLVQAAGRYFGSAGKRNELGEVS